MKLDGSEIDDKNIGKVFSFREGDSKGKEVAFNLSIANDKKQIKIKPNVLKKSTKYYFKVDGKKLKGKNGEKVIVKEIFFTTRIDDTKDISVSINIKNDERNVSISKELIIDFSDKVVKLDGSQIDDKNMGEVFSFKQGDNKGKEVAFSLNIANDKKQIKINPNVLKKSTKYYFQVDGKKLKGKNEEKVIGKEIFFTTESNPIGPFKITDPLYKDQWYLKNTGQFGGQPGIDINIEPVWKQGYTGQGMKVGIIDDLVDNKHPDLSDNVPSGNLVNYGKSKNCHGAHGTSVAGLIAARDNNIGIRGVAYRSELYSYFYEYVDKKGPVDLKRDIIRVLNRSELKKMAVYNGSLGMVYNGMIAYFYLSDPLKEAFDKATREGFYGKGSSLVFAAGNATKGNASNEPLSNHHATIVVNSINKDGAQVGVGNLAGGGTIGTNIWLVSPSQLGIGKGGNMITTDNVGACGDSKGDYRNFGATSGATPLVTGVVAILREVNPNLTYRDVKLILAESAKKLPSSEWRVSGKMYNDPQQDQKHHRRRGFGLVDAAAAVQLAKSWRLLPTMKKIELENNNTISTEKMDVTHPTTINVSSDDIKFIEFVSIEIDFGRKKQETLWERNFELSLVSPDGKEAFFYEKADDEHEISVIRKDEKKMRLLSNRFLGSSNIKGNWILKLKQSSKQKDEKNWITQIKGWKIIIRGH